MLEIINLEKRYKNKIILSNFNMKLDSRGIIFFLGKNGAGKTTFFNCIMGFEDYSGEIVKSRNIAAVFDESHLYSNLNAYDNIALLVRRDLDGDEQELMLKYIDVSVLKRKVKSYSLGQKKILSILIAIFTKPEMLILVCGHQFDFYNRILDEVFVIHDAALIHVARNEFTDLESVYEKYVG